MKEKLFYMKEAMFHPFDSFYEIRFRNKGSVGLAFIIMVIYGILQCVSYQYTGFIMNNNPQYEMNSISIFISSISLIALFCVSNWSVTSLFGGKGKVKDIYIMICYSIIPLIITSAITIFVSNFIIEEEILIVNAVRGIGLVWFVFLAVGGLCTIHEYTLGKNVLSLLATLIAAIVIVFILVLFFSLEERMVNFIISVAQEFMRRIR